MRKRKKKLVLAFSGGLDTSYCALYLAQERGYEVTTVIVNTGGHSAPELARIAKKAKAFGAVAHRAVDARRPLYDRFISYGIKGNLMRGGNYPLCVGIERTQQAIDIAELARAIKADAVAHGSTAAGNDQIRFDAVFHALIPEMTIVAPIREAALSREETAAYLKAHGHSVAAKTTKYSINQGLWGTTIGGGVTHDPAKPIPEEAYPTVRSLDKTPARPQRLRIGFHHGLPTQLNGKKINGLALIEKLTPIGARHGVGRGVHTGDTILGIKGRIAFEAPAATILLLAHRELEKLTLSKAQAMEKQLLCDRYADRLHCARYFEPAMRDIEAFIDSSQRTVTGEVRVALHQGQATVESVESPHSYFHATGSAYGEKAGQWTGADAESFAKIYALPAALARRAEGGAKS